jgi:GNAT superfamily N-acetyltransferase
MSRTSKLAMRPPGRQDEGIAQLTLDSYRATAHRITPDDRPLLHELTMGVFWPHRDHDLDLLLALGQGYLAVDEIGRAMGAAMYSPFGEDFAMLGMMVTAPRLQAQGTGRWLLNRIMADCADRDLRLSATRAAERLYESAGFQRVGTIWQHQGMARPIHLPDPVRGIETRAMAAEDLPAILALDLPAYGADRRRAFDALLPVSQLRVALCGDEIVGYAMMRAFGRGKVIGPVVAGDVRIAMQMIAPFVQAGAAEGSFIRLDRPVADEHYAAFLAASGMGLYDTVTEMRIGPQRRALKGPQLLGLAAHSLG